MKTAAIFSIPATSANGYTWRWRANDGKAASSTRFAYYYECLRDAKENGYTVEFSVPHGNTAPGWRSLTHARSLGPPA